MIRAADLLLALDRVTHARTERTQNTSKTESRTSAAAAQITNSAAAVTGSNPESLPNTMSVQGPDANCRTTLHAFIHMVAHKQSTSCARMAPWCEFNGGVFDWYVRAVPTAYTLSVNYTGWGGVERGSVAPAAALRRAALGHRILIGVAAVWFLLVVDNLVIIINDHITILVIGRNS